ncbi:MAG: hypothetical protein NTZ17_15995 [Phycisphaerae bacterium]|nr:hypothetical protein [Phycisphaerae bacterium]
MGLAWSIYSGRYDDEIEAARASDQKNVEINGEYAYLNFPADWPKERIKEVYEKAQAERLHHGGTEGTETGEQ